MIKKSALILAIMALFTGLVQAQKAPAILTVDLGQLYNDYWKAQEAQEKFNSSVENAQQEIQTMINEGMALAEEIQKLQEQLNNPALSESGKQNITRDLQSKAAIIREKEIEVNNYRQMTDRTLQQRRQSIINLHISEIREVVIEVAKSKNADLVLNTNGMAVVYFNESFDITNEVAAKLNVNKPAN